MARPTTDRSISNILYIICQKEEDDQQHIIRCKMIQDELKSDEIVKQNIKYEQLFRRDVRKQKTQTGIIKV